MCKEMDNPRLTTTKAYDRAQRVWASYDSYFDSYVRHVTHFEIGDWVYVDNRPNLSTSNFSNDPSQKLRPCKIGPTQVKCVHSHIVVVEKCGLLNNSLPTHICRNLQNDMTRMMVRNKKVHQVTCRKQQTHKRQRKTRSAKDSW